MSIFWILVIIIALLVVTVVFYYNSLIQLRLRVKEGLADIDVQVKRRFDLIPNLVETVKAYASHEQEVFQKVTEARSAIMGAQRSGNLSELAGANDMLTGALKSVFAVAEAYPELKASTNFNNLQMELSDTENKIQAARRFYNSVVQEYNVSIGIFPSNIIASMFHFMPADFFNLDASPAERENVKVDFSKPATPAN